MEEKAVKIKGTINANASGAWASREGEKVLIIDVKPNGLACRLEDKTTRHPAWIPRRWVTED
jgi:hypothetical protein